MLSFITRRFASVTLGPRACVPNSLFKTTPLVPIQNNIIQRNFSTSKPLQVTINQCIRGIRGTRRKKNRVKALEGNPFKKATVLKVMEMTPRKPNSAKRKVVKVKLSTGKIILSYVPGVGHSLQPHSIVLVRGGRCQDLTGIRYKCVRGRYDFAGVQGRMMGRSKYGTKKPKN
ncbi:ribosomal protein S12 [Acrasis kona]|uniref:Ribosomal protein S12 n=1 Tax=Acrasis kona TaxID=1008807 RepID=A0AAW2ZFR4_9EUKA